jgi:hypothetical protein
VRNVVIAFGLVDALTSAWRCALVGGCAVALLVACDSSRGIPAGKSTVPGAERQVGASASLPPPATNRQYDAGISAVDESRVGLQPLPVVPVSNAKSAEKATDKPEFPAPVSVAVDGTTVTLPPITPGESSSSLATPPVAAVEPPAVPPAPVLAPARSEPAIPPVPSRPPIATVAQPCRSSGLTPAAQSEFTRIADSLAGATRVEVRAFAIGEEDDGQAVAMGCALVVRSQLIDLGVRSRIDVNAYEIADGTKDRVEIFVPAP